MNSLAIILCAVIHDSQHFLQKLIQLKFGGIISCHIIVTQHLLDLIISYGLTRQLNNLIKKFIFRCVNSLFELIFLSKIEL